MFLSLFVGTLYGLQHINLRYLLLQRMRDVENQVFYFCRSVCSLSHICLAFLHFLFLNVALVAIVWLFTTICFQMRGCKVTLVVLLFSAVRFQMFPQIACFNGCKVTLVTFVWFFSTVRFQMCPQIACIRGCKVTLVVFAWLFSTVRL